MQTYWVSFKKLIDNIGSKKVIMTNKVVRGKSRCANFMDDKSELLKQKLNKKSISSKINSKLFIHYFW